MRELKQSVAAQLYVRIADTSNVGITGIADTGVTAKLSKNGLSFSAFTVTSGNWTEVGNGIYSIALATGNTDTLGGLLFGLFYTAGGSELFIEAQVVANVEADTFARLGAPAGASIAADLATIDDFIDAEVAAIKAKTDNLPSDPADQSLIIAATDAIFNRIGAPAGASVSADIASIKTDATTLLTRTLQLLGLTNGHNTLRDDMTFDVDGKLTAARIRLYDTAANATAAEATSPAGGTTGLLATWNVVAAYDGDNLETFKVVAV
jgi:hypothetical protein